MIVLKMVTRDVQIFIRGYDASGIGPTGVIARIEPAAAAAGNPARPGPPLSGSVAGRTITVQRSDTGNNRLRLGGRQQRQVGVNERRPGGRALALRRRRQTVALQDIADRLMAYTISQIGQRPGNPVITPVPVLLGQTNDQLLDLAVTRGRPGPRRAFEPSNLWATSLRYRARMVSGLARVATWARAVRPSRCPISPSVERSVSESFKRPAARWRAWRTAGTSSRRPLEARRQDSARSSTQHEISLLKGLPTCSQARCGSSMTAHQSC
jgi:hypothetical protein